MSVLYKIMSNNRPVIFCWLQCVWTCVMYKQLKKNINIEHGQSDDTVYRELKMIHHTRCNGRSGAFDTS